MGTGHAASATLPDWANIVSIQSATFCAGARSWETVQSAA